jgi:L-iditol 2-dehydrogenase
MLAVRKVAEGKDQVFLKEVEEPTVSGSYVVLEVKACGICGTDEHIVADEYKTTPPLTLGHELSGVVSKVGPDVTGWKVGDRVTTETFYRYCGKCKYCLMGKPNLCIDRQSIGTHVDGGFAKYIRVPARNLHRLPDNVDFIEGAIIEPLACCTHVVCELTNIEPGDVVIVSGPGPIGLICMQLAKAAGGTVILTGATPDKDRLQLGKELGADFVFDVMKEEAELVKTINDLTGGYGADVAIECSGNGHAVNFAIGHLRKAGQLSQIGLFSKPIQADFSTIALKELNISGSFAHNPPTWERAIKILEAKKVNLKPLVSKISKLEDWDEAIAYVKSKQGLKVLIQP